MLGHGGQYGGDAYQTSVFRARDKDGESLIPLYKDNDTPQMRKSSANLIILRQSACFLTVGLILLSSPSFLTLDCLFLLKELRLYFYH